MLLRPWGALVRQCITRYRTTRATWRFKPRRCLVRRGSSGFAIAAEVLEFRMLLSAYNFKVMSDAGTTALKAYTSLAPIGIDAAGDVAFSAFNASAPNSYGRDIFFASGVGGTPTLIAGGRFGEYVTTAAMNSKGTIAYNQITLYSGLHYGGSANDGIHAVSNDGTPTFLVKTDPANVNFNGYVYSHSLYVAAMSLADDNTVAFDGQSLYAIGPADDALYVEKPNSSLNLLASIDGFPNSTAINARNQIVYRGVQGNLVLADAGGASSAVIVAANHLGPPAINDRGIVAYVAANAHGDDGIYTYDPSTVGNPKLIVDTTSSSFATLGSYVRNVAISKEGTVAFEATLNDGRTGIFTGPDSVNDRVIATGDTLFGARVDKLSFIPWEIRGSQCFNAQNQLVFAAHLAAGAASRWVIVRANVDTPTSPALKTITLLVTVHGRCKEIGA